MQSEVPASELGYGADQEQTDPVESLSLMDKCLRIPQISTVIHALRSPQAALLIGAIFVALDGDDQGIINHPE